MSTRPPRETGNSFVDTRSLVFWLFLGLTLWGTIQLYPLLFRGLTVYPGPAALAAVLWLVYGLLLFWILYRLELFERRSPVTMLGAVVWGALVVSGIGVIASPAMSELVGKIVGPELEDWIPAIAAPLVEEPLKMLGVVALAFIPGSRIDSALDGLFYGLLVGLGFEVTESFLYTVQGSMSEGGDFMMVVLTFILRGIVGGLWNHPTYTAITGAGVGYFFGSRANASRRWLVMLGSLLAAMVLHGFFDSPLLESGNPFLSSIVKGIPALVLALVLVRVTRNRERAVFQSIGEDGVPADLVSADELKSLLRKSDRRKARRSVRKQGGLAASHAMRRLQRAQIDLVEAVGAGGPDAETVRQAAEEVRREREVLAQTLTGS